MEIENKQEEKIEHPILSPPEKIEEKNLDIIDIWNRWMDFNKGIGFDMAIAFYISVAIYLLIVAGSRYFSHMSWRDSHLNGIIICFVSFIILLLVIGLKKGWLKKTVEILEDDKNN